MADPHMIKQKSALTEPLILSLVGLAGYGLVFLTNVILSRLMGSEVFGDYNVAFAALSIFSSLALVGTDNAANRFIPHIAKTGGDGGLRNYLAWNLRWLVRPFVMVIGLAAAVVVIAALTDALGYKRFEDYHLAFHVLWIAPVAALNLLLGSYFVSLGHSILGGVFRNFAANALILGYVALAVWLFDLPIGHGAVILGVWAASFASLILVQITTLKLREPAVYSVFKAAIGTPAADVEKTWATTSMWMLVTTINNIVLWHLDLFIVEIVAPDEASTGYYAAILLIARMLHLVPLYVMFMVTPKVGYAIDQPEDYQGLQRAIDGANAIVVGTSIVMLAGIVIWRREILDLFGPGYRSADTALIFLAVGIFIGALTRQSRAILMASGGEKIVSRASAVGLVVLAVAGVPAIYYFSLDGIAVVSGAVVACQNLVFFAFAKYRLSGIRPLTVV